MLASGVVPAAVGGLGTEGDDVFTVKLDATGENYEVFEGSPAMGSPVLTWPTSGSGPLVLETLGGNDRVVVSLGLNLPETARGIAVHGGAGNNELVAVHGRPRIEAMDAVGGTLNASVGAGVQMTSNGFAAQSLTIGSGGSLIVAPNGGPGGLVVLEDLAMGQLSTLDLNDNDLVLNYEGGAPLEEMQSLILNGFIDGDNIAPRITSTVGRAAGDTYLVAVDNAGIGADEWLGVPLDPSHQQIIVKYTYFGDVNFDGQINAQDYVVVDNHFGGTAAWLNGDGNLDGVIDANDYVIIDNNFGKGVGDPLGGVEPVVASEGNAPLATELAGLAIASDEAPAERSAPDWSDALAVWGAQLEAEGTSRTGRGTRDRALLSFLGRG